MERGATVRRPWQHYSKHIFLFAICSFAASALFVASLSAVSGDLYDYNPIHSLRTTTNGWPVSRVYSISNSAYHVEVNTTKDGVAHISGLSLLANRASKTFTKNLAMGPQHTPLPGHLSSSQILSGGHIYQSETNGGQWVVDSRAKGTDSATLTSPELLLGPKGDPLLKEKWVLSLSGRRLRWTLDREWLRSAVVDAERNILSFMTVGFPPVYGSQVPGVLDLTMKMNGTSGFYLGERDAKDQCYTNTEDTGAPCIYELLFGSPRSIVHLAPSNIRLCSRQSGADGLSLSKPWADGTATLASVGPECVDRTAPEGTKRSAGDHYTVEWEMNLATDDEDSCTAGLADAADYPPDFAGDLNLSLPAADPVLRDTVKTFVHVQNQWLGYVFGNNPASVPCLHEMGWFGWIQSMMSTKDPRVFDALKKELSMFASGGTMDNGYVMPRWNVKGFYYVPWGPLVDQIPHFVIAVHAVVVSTGDKAWLESILPAVTRVVAHIVSSLNGDGVFVSGASYHPDGTVHQPASTGIADGKHHSANWYDVIESGHLDANNAAYAVVALDSAADMYWFAGDATKAEECAAHASRAREGHQRTFWSEKDGHFVDWVDINGESHSHLYMDHNMIALAFGIASPSQAKRVVSEVDNAYEEIYRRKNVTEGADVFSTPCNLKPLTQRCENTDNHRPAQPCSNDHPPYDPWTNYPTYENGQAFFHTVGFEAAGRAAAGDRSNSWRVFKRLMIHGVKENRGWAQGSFFKSLLGQDPLNNAMLSVWGALRGLMRVVPTLKHGVLMNDDTYFPAGSAVPEMEGARWVFAYLGEDFCVEMKGGRSVRCT